MNRLRPSRERRGLRLPGLDVGSRAGSSAKDLQAPERQKLWDDSFWVSLARMEVTLLPAHLWLCRRFLPLGSADSRFGEVKITQVRENSLWFFLAAMKKIAISLVSARAELWPC